MSFDIWLEIDTGGRDPATVAEAGNYTCNVSCMWRYALGFSLRDIHGRLASEVALLLAPAVAHMANPANRKVYLAMQPGNGWGNHDGATKYLARLLRLCRQHPRATVRVCA